MLAAPEQGLQDLAERLNDAVQVDVALGVGMALDHALDLAAAGSHDTALRMAQASLTRATEDAPEVVPRSSLTIALLHEMAGRLDDAEVWYAKTVDSGSALGGVDGIGVRGALGQAQVTTDDTVRTNALTSAWELAAAAQDGFVASAVAVQRCRIAANRGDAAAAVDALIRGRIAVESFDADVTVLNDALAALADEMGVDVIDAALDAWLR